MDLLGQILWFLMFLTPLVTIPLAWLLLPARRITRLLAGLLLALILSFLLYQASLAIIFRQGMGPG